MCFFAAIKFSCHRKIVFGNFTGRIEANGLQAVAEAAK
jgi:hypothetical protein